MLDLRGLAALAGQRVDGGNYMALGKGRRDWGRRRWMATASPWSAGGRCGHARRPRLHVRASTGTARSPGSFAAQAVVLRTWSSSCRGSRTRTCCRRVTVPVASVLQVEWPERLTSGAEAVKDPAVAGRGGCPCVRPPAASRRTDGSLVHSAAAVISRASTGISLLEWGNLNDESSSFSCPGSIPRSAGGLRH